MAFALKLLSALGIAALFGPGTVCGAAGDLYGVVVINGVGSSVETVERFRPDGTRTTFATDLPSAGGIAFDRAGNLFVSLSSRGEIVKITLSGTRTTFASGLDRPGSIALDAAGFLFVLEAGPKQIVKFAPDGTKSTFATGLTSPSGLAFDRFGNLFTTELFADATRLLDSISVVVKFSQAGEKSTFATTTGVNSPGDVAVDRANNVYFTTFVQDGQNYFKYSGTIEKVTQAGSRTTFATGMTSPHGLAFDPAGNLFVVNSGYEFGIFKFLPNGAGSRFAPGLATGDLAFEPPLSQPLNVSTRLNVQTVDNVLIAGFIATGTAGKKVLIRGIGPSLATFDMPGLLQDPVLELHGPDGTLIVSNDNWKINDETHQSQEAVILAAGLPPADDRESALLLELLPAGFTAILRGKNDTTGVGLMEIYDLNQTADALLANISSRGFVDTGTNGAMIAGFIIGAGNGAAKVLVRGLGPSLAALGIATCLANPNVEVRDINGATVAANDDWKSSLGGTGLSQQAEIESTGAPPSNNLESALVVTLPVGNYTAILTGSNSGSASLTGVAVVEVYNLR